MCILKRVTNTHTYAIPSAHIQMDVCTSGNSIHTEFGCGLLVLNVFKSSTITYMQQTDSKAQYKITTTL
jgi:hypothetical protein